MRNSIGFTMVAFIAFAQGAGAARPVVDEHQSDMAQPPGEKVSNAQAYEDPSFDNGNINVQGLGVGSEFESAEVVEIPGFNIGVDGMMTISDPDDGMGDRSYDAAQLGMELDKSNGNPAGPLGAQLAQPSPGGAMMSKPLFAIQSRKRMQELLMQMFGSDPQAPQPQEELIQFIQTK